jgi:nucleoside-diphosphate-sugar epimerase
MQSTVLILGASGNLGAALVSAFATAGWRVIAQTRPQADVPSGAQPTNVQWLRADMADATNIAAFTHLAPLQVVVHAVNPAYTRWAAEAKPLLQTAINISLHFNATLMFPGNVYNFGAGMPYLLKENTLQQPTSLKGGIRMDMEQQLEQAAKTHRLRSVIIRAGDYFGGVSGGAGGGGSGSWFERWIAKDARQGQMGYMGPGGIDTPWAYVPDLAQAFVQVAQRRTQLNSFETLHFAGHQLRRQDWEQMMQKASVQLGWLQSQQALSVQPMPWGLIGSMAWAVPKWRELAEMRYLWLTPHLLEGKKLAQLVGKEPHTPIESALMHALLQLYQPEPKGLVLAHPNRLALPKRTHNVSERFKLPITKTA